MTDKQQTVANIALHTSKATQVGFDDLHTWVIWQFPRKNKKEGGLFGAVHPPLAEYGWLPAIIHIKDQNVSIHGHLEKTFPSPETAADFLES